MPSRNVLKVDVEHSYYHIYARGASKQKILVDEQDYVFFTRLFERYLSKEVTVSKKGTIYPKYSGKIELLCYCLMSNHFHLLIYQIEPSAMSKLMKSIMTSYSRYFNLKYKRSGPVFESRYKASRIDQQTYLEHISRYIHMNPRYWKQYPYSSIAYFTKAKTPTPDWLKPNKILGLFRSKKSYAEFVANYEDHRQVLEEIKYDLADH